MRAHVRGCAHPLLKVNGAKPAAPTPRPPLQLREGTYTWHRAQQSLWSSARSARRSALRRATRPRAFSLGSSAAAEPAEPQRCRLLCRRMRRFNRARAHIPGTGHEIPDSTLASRRQCFFFLGKKHWRHDDANAFFLHCRRRDANAFFFRVMQLQCECTREPRRVLPRMHTGTEKSMHTGTEKSTSTPTPMAPLTQMQQVTERDIRQATPATCAWSTTNS